VVATVCWGKWFTVVQLRICNLIVWSNWRCNYSVVATVCWGKGVTVVQLRICDFLNIVYVPQLKTQFTYAILAWLYLMIGPYCAVVLKCLAWALQRKLFEIIRYILMKNEGFWSQEVHLRAGICFNVGIHFIFWTAQIVHKIFTVEMWKTVKKELFWISLNFSTLTKNKIQLETLHIQYSKKQTRILYMIVTLGAVCAVDMTGLV